MEEERLMILKMLEEGKISSEEAAALFEALDEHQEKVVISPANPESGPDAPGLGPCCGGEAAGDSSTGSRNRMNVHVIRHQSYDHPEWDQNNGNRGANRQNREHDHDHDRDEDGWDDFGRRMEDFGERVSKAAEELGERLGERFSKLGEEFSERFSEGKIPFLLGFGECWGPSFQFEEVISGEFSGETGPIALSLKGVNGNLTVSAWDEPGYRIEMLKTVRGHHEEDARARANGLVTVKSDERGLLVENHHRSGTSVRIVVKVPGHLLYTLSAKNTNGHIRILNRLKFVEARAMTTNGNILTEQIIGGMLELQSTNGKIYGQVQAKQLNAATTNGRISLQLQGEPGGEYVLRTSNGRIELGIPQEWPFRTEATSQWGSLDIDCHSVIYHERSAGNHGGNRRIRAERTGDGAVPTLKLHSSNGSVRVYDIEREGLKP